MKRFVYASAFAALAVSFVGAQTKTTLLITSRYGTAESSDAAANQTLREFKTHDVLAVTPGQGATAHAVLTTANYPAFIGDPDDDDKKQDFMSGIVSTGLVGPFVKWDDKKNFDPRNIYHTVKVRSNADPIITVWTKDTKGATITWPVATGDFFRILDDGHAEFFITQALIMKAAGNQTGSWVNGAICICQDKDKNLYYAGPHAVTASGSGLAGGHWVANGANRQFLYDAGIAMIPASAITYDTVTGNVKDVTAASTVVIANEIGNPTNQPNVRDMVGNSAHIDDKGTHDNVTFWMTGIDTVAVLKDPQKPTFTGWDGKQHPHLMFTIVRTVFSGFGSWKTTIFSTEDYKNNPGDVARVNGILMGSQDPKTPADGSWVGLKDQVASSNAPILGGLQWVETGWNSTAPHGHTAGDASTDGSVPINATFELAFQGPSRLLPATLYTELGFLKKGRVVGANLSPGGFLGYATYRPWPPLIFTLWSTGPRNLKGEYSVKIAVPNDPNLVGDRLNWTGIFLEPGGKLFFSPTVLTEFVK